MTSNKLDKINEVMESILQASKAFGMKEELISKIQAGKEALNQLGDIDFQKKSRERFQKFVEQLDSTLTKLGELKPSTLMEFGKVFEPMRKALEVNLIDSVKEGLLESEYAKEILTLIDKDIGNNSKIFNADSLIRNLRFDLLSLNLRLVK